MRLLEKLTRKGSHCAVEWDEPGNPRSVVLTKNVTGMSGEDYEVGDVCKVRIREGSKMSVYEATVIGIGEYLGTNTMHALNCMLLQVNYHSMGR